MLIDDVRVALRVTSTMTDPEIRTLIDAAIEDMRRVGVRDELLCPESMNSLAKSAVVMYCKAAYGFDNSAASLYMQWYNQTVTSLMNSSLNECDEDGS